MTASGPLAPETVAGYVRTRPTLASRIDADTLAAQEVGDGNLNLVFLCRDGDGRCLCLKQALPYLRLVGPSWPLTPERVVAEARSLRLSARVAPGLVPELYDFDADRHVIAMEDLSDGDVWRSGLNRGERAVGVATTVGEYVARMTFATSPVGSELSAVRRLAAESVNPELCRITEDLVLSQPFVVHPDNSFPAGLADDVRALREDGRLLAAVARLARRFATVGEALIHGDLHTGSVMTVPRPVPGRVIDPEFCCYGPVGYDLGLTFANYLHASARAQVTDAPPAQRRWLDGLAAETWEAFSSGLWTLWPERVATAWPDEALAAWLDGIFADAVGYAGCEATRRVVGLAKVTDLTTLEPDQQVEAGRIVLATARRWLTADGALRSPGELFAA